MALFVTHAERVSGAEIALARYLERRPDGHAVLLLAPGECAELFGRLGVPVSVHPLLGGRAGAPRTLGHTAAAGAALELLPRLPWLAAHLRRSGQRVVVSNSMKAHALAVPAARAAGLAAGIRLHDMVERTTVSAPARAALVVAGRLAGSTAAVSEAAAGAARAAGLPRVRVLRNGVEPGPRPRPRGPARRALVLSQLAPWKGVDLALDALCLARERGAGVVLDVVGAELFGERGHAEALRAHATALGLDGQVTWHGRVADVRPLLASADVLLHLPRAADPLPNAVLEAQALGLPVVAAATGGIPELVADGETGILVPPDDPGAAAAALLRLADGALRDALAAAAWERARRRFALERHVADVDAWLASLATHP